MVDSIRPLTDLQHVPAAAAPEKAPDTAPQQEQKLYVKIPSEQDPVLRRIGLILNMFPGRTPMVIWCEKERKRLGARCLLHEGLLLELRELLGGDAVVLK